MDRNTCFIRKTCSYQFHCRSKVSGDRDIQNRLRISSFQDAQNKEQQQTVDKLSS